MIINASTKWKHFFIIIEIIKKKLTSCLLNDNNCELLKNLFKS